MKKLLILFAVMLLSIPALSQERSKFLYAEVADHSLTLWPFYKPFGGHFDPAVTLGAGMDYRQKKNRTLFQTAQGTWYSTEMIGRGVTLSTSFGYRYGKTSGLFAEGMLGLGTSLFFSPRQTYIQDESGEYEPANPLHVVAALPIDLVIGYGSVNLSIYAKYRYMIIGPITEIMPVLPNAQLGIGMRYTINNNGE